MDEYYEGAYTGEQIDNALGRALDLNNIRGIIATAVVSSPVAGTTVEVDIPSALSGKTVKGVVPYSAQGSGAYDYTFSVTLSNNAGKMRITPGATQGSCNYTCLFLY